MAIVGVAKFLGCEKTLVKNPSEAVGPYSTSDRRQSTGFFFSPQRNKRALCAGLVNISKGYNKKKEEAMGAEEEKKKT